MDLSNLPKALRFFGRFAAETEEQARLRRCKEREAAADRIEDLERQLAACVEKSGQWAARAGAAEAKLEAKRTDLSHRLRETADQQPGWRRLLTEAADEIDRYFGGMCAWKQTAETKDRQWNESLTQAISARCAARAIAGVTLPSDWPQRVNEAWACLRKHNSSIPDDTLDLMRDALLAAGQPAYDQQARSALLLAQEALNASKPTHAHYPEPVARHTAAQEAVSAALASIPATGGAA